jgi:CubicO group peptidase (beta-lactamase class C family)
MKVRRLRLLHLAAFIPGLACSTPDAIKLPDTPLGASTREWLRLCQAPSLEQLTQWTSANIADEVRKAPKDIAQEDVDFCNENGGVKVGEVLNASPTNLTLKVVGEKSGIWFELSRGVNEAGRLNQARTSPTAPPESALPQDGSDAGIARQVRASVARLSQAGLFSGIVTVARGAQVIVMASAGYADRVRQTPMTGSSQFTLGSMGKMFTAAAIGQLIDQRKLSLSDTVGKFFPDYPDQVVRDKVTVEMLLSHTAGMGDFLGKRSPSMMKAGVKRAAEFMPLYDHDQPAFPPGTSWGYSNAGLALAGAIVEKVSGEDYPDYLRKHIFAVAGMTHSDPNNIPHTSSALVTPYTKMTEEGPPALDWHEAEHDIGSPAGGAISTANDLVRFADSLRNGKLMSKRVFELMTRPNSHSPKGYPYGDAFEIADIYGRTVVGHGGGFPGVSTHLYIFLDSPYTVVALANQDPPAEMYVGSLVTALVAEKAKTSK